MVYVVILTVSQRWCSWCAFVRDPSWRHQMETLSALLTICAGNSPVPHKGQRHGTLMLSVKQKPWMYMFSKTGINISRTCFVGIKRCFNLMFGKNDCRSDIIRKTNFINLIQIITLEDIFPIMVYLIYSNTGLVDGLLLELKLSEKGPPYIPRVHLSEGSLVRSPLKWLWSEEPMVRRSFIPKFPYSESCYIPKIPYSERPSTIWILCYEDSLVRSSSSPKGAMFRTSIFRKSPLPPTGSILRRSFSPKFPQF